MFMVYNISFCSIGKQTLNHIISSNQLKQYLIAAHLFLVYVNDLEEGVTREKLKFADDTKLFRRTKNIGYKHKIQD